MSDVLKVETPLLDRDVQSIEEQIGIVKKCLENLRTDEAALETMGEGSAKDAFREQFNSDCTEIEEVILMLETFKESLAKASKEYTLTSEDVSSLIRAAKI